MAWSDLHRVLHNDKWPTNAHGEGQGGGVWMVVLGIDWALKGKVIVHTSQRLKWPARLAHKLSF